MPAPRAAAVVAACCAAACVSPPPVVEKQPWPEQRAAAPAPKPQPSAETLRRLEALSARCAARARDACLELSRAYAGGANGVAPDPDKAAAPLAKLCAGGDADACRRLEKAFEAEDTAPKELALVNAAFRSACDLRVGDACVGLSASYLYGLGVTEWPARSAALLERGCDLGNARACRRLAAYHLTGYGLERPDRGTAIDLVDKACTGGDQPACVHLGLRLLRGAGMFADVPRGLALLTAACRKGEAQGCVAEAMVYRDGIGVDADEPRARALFRAACERGHATACVSVATMIRKGKGGRMSARDAYRWLDRGCTLRDGYACFLAGAEYHQVRKLTEQGEGFLEAAPDYDKARQLYEKACMLHAPEGCDALDYVYSYGIGVPVDPRKAGRYAELACEYGAVSGCARRKPRPWMGYDVD